VKTVNTIDSGTFERTMMTHLILFIRYFLLSLWLLLPALAWAKTSCDNDFIHWAQTQQQKAQQILATSDTHAVLQTSQRQQLYLMGARKLLKETKNTIHPISPAKNTFIFVSFSMPLQSLKQWLSQAQPYGAMLVLRGLVHQSFRETATHVAEVLDGKKGGLQINPELFKKFQITQVPAVVQVHEDESYDIVYGDIGLPNAIEQLSPISQQK
jgi:type-F conjugative transfer system pilin assembly protein TrbC